MRVVNRVTVTEENYSEAALIIRSVVDTATRFFRGDGAQILAFYARKERVQVKFHIGGPKVVAPQYIQVFDAVQEEHAIAVQEGDAPVR